MTEQQEFANFQEIPYSEQLVAKIGSNLPLEELRTALAPVALLGAARRLGIAFRPAEDVTFTLELANTLADKEGKELSSVRVGSLSIRDITSSYIPISSVRVESLSIWDIASSYIPTATSPRAIEFAVGNSAITIYTPNTEDENPVLEFELMSSETDEFRLTIDREEPSNSEIVEIELRSYQNLDPYISFTETYETTYHEGNPLALRVSRRIALADALILESKRVWNRIERIKALAGKEAPSEIVEIEKMQLAAHIYTFSELLGAKLSKEQVDEIAQRSLSDPAEEIIQGVFDAAGESVSPLVLQLFKARLTAAEVSPPIEWSVSASFSVEDQDTGDDISPSDLELFKAGLLPSAIGDLIEGRKLIVERVEGITHPTPTSSQWERVVEQFTQGEASRELLFELRYMKEFLDADFENFTALFKP